MCNAVLIIHANFKLSFPDMVGNSVMWQHLEVEDLLLYHKEKILLYYKEKIHESGRAFVLREVHHEECARRLNEKYGTNFTWKQTYNKYHKLKGEWKLIMEAKSAKGASFDDVQKKIIYDEIEVVKMKAVSIHNKYLCHIYKLHLQTG